MENGSTWKFWGVLVCIGLAIWWFQSSGCQNSDLKDVDMPSNGAVLSGSSGGGASYKITASSSDSCYVKVINSAGKTQVGFFVRAGSSAEVSVPTGTYNVHFAYGEKWYGKENLFGKNTTYGQDKQSVTLNLGDQMTYSMQKKSSGNFRMSSLSASDF